MTYEIKDLSGSTVWRSAADYSNYDTISWLYAELEWRHNRLVKAIRVLEQPGLRSKIKRHFIKTIPMGNVSEGSHV